jgi:plasmid maintenance system antidote protein VapI
MAAGTIEMNSPEPTHLRILRARLTERKNRNVLYSLRAYARDLGVDPSRLCRILKGRQEISTGLCLQISRRLHLSDDETQEFVTSVADRRREEFLRRMRSSLAS